VGIPAKKTNSNYSCNDPKVLFGIPNLSFKRKIFCKFNPLFCQKDLEGLQLQARLSNYDE